MIETSTRTPDAVPGRCASLYRGDEKIKPGRAVARAGAVVPGRLLLDSRRLLARHSLDDRTVDLLGQVRLAERVEEVAGLVALGLEVEAVVRVRAGSRGNALGHARRRAPSSSSIFFGLLVIRRIDLTLSELQHVRGDA